ncbi:hypothetical protein IEN85_20070 [Pelagicoccus sp. NFK12]|uniref:Pilus assembly protein, PilO n=1 Tax=Pelagicoccus enzymogenes TaxID=2773457 RepID=A0A927FB20_9BACT|nr:hypothetical protein [Pelagicoccus enzymogenes]MBD5781808.1 hypothetical protein [Pelagicoccus enzymogenes]
MTFLSLFSYLKKNYIVSICSLVAIVCLGVYLVRSDQITRLAADYDDLSVRHSRILKNLKFGSDIEADLDRLKTMSEEIEARLFSPEDLATNQRYFYQIESATGVEMASIQQIIKPLPEGKNNKQARMKAERSPYQEIIYDMSVQGTYTEVLSFLREIEGGEAFAVLDGFTIMDSKSKEADPEVDIRLSVNVLGRKS